MARRQSCIICSDEVWESQVKELETQLAEVRSALTEAHQQADAVAAAVPPADTVSEVDKVGHGLNLEISLTLCSSYQISEWCNRRWVPAAL